MAIQKCKDLEVYNLSFNVAMDVFNVTKTFPRDEKYALVDQIRRSSRSISANIREGFAKRRYPDVFVRHLNDALGSSEETLTWIEFAHSCGYLNSEQFHELTKRYEQIGKMIYSLMTKWEKF